ASKQASLTDKLKITNEQKSLSHSKLVIAHSKMMRDELVQFYNIDSNKISTIYPPVDINKFILPESDNKRSALRERFGFNDNEIIYLFPSTGHKRKGFDILKEYFENSALPIRLVVAGTPVPESKNISSLGYCKNMPELYQATDYTIMASIYEPFGLVGIESILSGTPIIFSDNIGCLEVLKNNFGYSFSRENLNTLDNAIKESVKKAKAFKHRINNPFDCIDYNPSLLSHVERLLEEIKQL
ncbi:glycosyltransferase family 4 protein, partial [Rodentibacter trehalosifermentans]